MASKRYDVDENEEIARILFEPSMIEDDDRISRNAFFLERLPSGKWEKYLSVWRTRYKVPTRENAKDIKPRKPLDKLFGYGTLNVGFVHFACIDLSVTAKVWRTKPNEEEHHVGIFYTLKEEPIIGESDNPDFIELTMILADEAVLFKFPPADTNVIKDII